LGPGQLRRAGQDHHRRPEDLTASPRSIRECFPRPDIRMQVVDLDEASGDFVLERIKTTV
jgi:hypothetical protein